MNEIEAIINNLHTNKQVKSLGFGFSAEFYQMYKDKITTSNPQIIS